MNRKFVLMVFVLLVGAVFLSACQSEVGIRPAKKLATGGSDTSPSKIMAQTSCTEPDGGWKGFKYKCTTECADGREVIWGADFDPADNSPENALNVAAGEVGSSLCGKLGTI